MSGLGTAAVSKLGAGLRENDGGDCGREPLAGEASSDLEQVDLTPNGDASFLDAVMGFVEIGAVERSEGLELGKFRSRARDFG
jgi:hypothetical protein